MLFSFPIDPIDPVFNTVTKFIKTFSGIENENHEASPKLRSRSIFCPEPDQPMTPSSSRSCSSYINLESSEPDYSGNSSSATIKPISLASKFDCFSDSD